MNWIADLALRLAMLALAALAAYWVGLRDGDEQADARHAAAMAEADHYAQSQLIRLTQRAGATERALRSELDAQTTRHQKEISDEKDVRNRLERDLRARTVRLSVPVAACAAAGGPGGADPAAADRPGAARAELASETAVSLVGIASDGDDAIRDLNRCIAAYNLVRDKHNAQAE